LIYIIAGIILFIIGVRKKMKLDINGIRKVYDKLIASIRAIDPIDSKLIFAICFVESSGNEKAISPCGAKGLMQIMPIVLKEYNQVTNSDIKETDLFTVKINLSIGSWYIHRLIYHYNFNLYDALRAYNGGIGNVRKDTQISGNYACKVLDVYYTVSNW
jgi:soluble lytic murein transglycosylase-like protein